MAKTSNVKLALKLQLCFLMSIVYVTPIQAIGSEAPLSKLEQSLDRCLFKASRPGFPYYDRPEASEACEEAKMILQQYGQEANRNRNLSCSSRVPILDFDLWMTRFLGEKRMRGKVHEDFKQLVKNCYHSF